MSISLLPPSGHPVVSGLAAARDALDLTSVGDPLYLSTAAKAAALREVAELERRMTGLKLALLAASEDVAAEHGARSPAAWLAHHTRTDYGPAAREGRLADALDGRWRLLGEAVREGRVSVEQAHVITHALDRLPAEVGVEVLSRAERHLIELADSFSPQQLRVLGRKVLDVVAPDIADDHERKLLESEESAARRRCSLTTRRHGDGTTTITLKTPDATAARLQTYLDAYANPRRDDGTRADTEAADRRPYPVRLGHAFCALIENLPERALPRHGGAATSVVVMVGLDQLRSGTGAATLSSGETISIGEARRLACQASILPAVLGGASEVLDLGRSRRLYSSAQHKALAIRDRQCRAEGCTIPASWCEAHHVDPWSTGGHTDLDRGVLLCSHHHHRAHDPAYTVLRGPTWRFTRRT